MEHERQNSPERLNESPRPTFNLEDMEPDQVALLVAAIGAAIDAEFKAQENELNKPPILNAALVELLGDDMQTLPARNPEKAKELFNVLVTHSEHWSRELAARMGPGLMRSQLSDHNERQQTLDAWLRPLEDRTNLSERAQFSPSPTALTLTGSMSPWHGIWTASCQMAGDAKPGSRSPIFLSRTSGNQSFISIRVARLVVAAYWPYLLEGVERDARPRRSNTRPVRSSTVDDQRDVSRTKNVKA